VDYSNYTLSVARYQLAATSVAHFALFGGGSVTSVKPSAVVDIFNSISGEWTTASLSVARGFLAATSVSNYALFGGGREGAGQIYNRVDIFNIISGLWTTASLKVPRTCLAATSVSNFALFGGGFSNYSLNPSDVVDIFNSISGEWTTASLSVARGFLAATSVSNYALFGGGMELASGLGLLYNRVDIFNSISGLWATATLSVARYALAATSVANFALFGGGFDNSFKPSAVVDIFNSISGGWTTASLTVARCAFAATSVSSLALFGGGAVGEFSTSFKVVDIFNSTSGVWTTASLTVARGFPSATSVSNLALFVGGYVWSVAAVPYNAVDVLLSSCLSGFFVNGTGGCGLCPPGFFCPPASSSPPIPCAPGCFCPAGSGESTPCPAGSSCPLGSGAPCACKVFEYQPSTGKSACLPCPLAISPRFNATTCQSQVAAPSFLLLSHLTLIVMFCCIAIAAIVLTVRLVRARHTFSLRAVHVIVCVYVSMFVPYAVLQAASLGQLATLYSQGASSIALSAAQSSSSAAFAAFFALGFSGQVSIVQMWTHVAQQHNSDSSSAPLRMHRALTWTQKAFVWVVAATVVVYVIGFAVLTSNLVSSSNECLSQQGSACVSSAQAHQQSCVLSLQWAYKLQHYEGVWAAVVLVLFTLLAFLFNRVVFAMYVRARFGMLQHSASASHAQQADGGAGAVAAAAHAGALAVPALVGSAAAAQRLDCKQLPNCG